VNYHKQTLGQGDLGGCTSHQIADAARHPKLKRLPLEQVGEVKRSDAGGIACQRDERDGIADLPVNLAPWGANQPSRLCALPQLDLYPPEPGMGQQQDIRDRHIQSPADRPKHGDVLRALINCCKEGKLKIGLIFLGWRDFKRDAARLELPAPCLPQRVEVTDDQIEAQTEHISETAACIGSHYKGRGPTSQPLADGFGIADKPI
jgi:hypothetical protein